MSGREIATWAVCALVKTHADEVRETILQYQTIVSGRCDELCELTVVLGFVQCWWHEAHSKNQMERRKAFSCIACVAHYEPVRRIVGSLAADALEDPDEQVRLDAARIMLAAGQPAAVARVFEGVISDTPEVRRMIAGELGRYADQLCQSAVPRALRCLNPLNVLKLLVSWERALPLADVRSLAEHSDPKVRVEVMRCCRICRQPRRTGTRFRLGWPTQTMTSARLRQPAV